MIEKIYNDMLQNFHDTLEATSNDSKKSESMTTCQSIVVNIDKLKDDFVRKMRFSVFPKSCDALLYMAFNNEFFIIEFKNGRIMDKEYIEIKEKIFETLLLLSEQFEATTKYMRKKMNFILVYNENVTHGQKQFEDTGRGRIQKTFCKLTKRHEPKFGLYRFKKMYFKDVFTYTKTEFESEFVKKHCMEATS